MHIHIVKPQVPPARPYYPRPAKLTRPCPTRKPISFG